MKETQQLLDHFAQLKNTSLPALRMSLRACLHSESSLGDVIHEKNRIFCLLTGGIVWPDSILREIWADVYSHFNDDFTDSRSDLVALLSLCDQGNSSVQNDCRNQAVIQLRQRPRFLRRIVEVSVKALEFDSLLTKGQPQNLEYVRSLYALNTAEVRILEVAALSSARSDFRSFLKHFPLNSRRDTWNVLSSMTGTTLKELQVALAPRAILIRSGLVCLDVLPNNQEELVRLGEVGIQLFFLPADSQDDLREQMLSPLPTTSLNTENFVDQQQEIEWTVRCLRNARNAVQGGVHILIHGPSGVGKSELARLLLKEAGMNGFNADFLERDGLSTVELKERIQSMYWAEALLGSDATSVLVVERVDDLASAGSVVQALLIEALERIRIPTIWICNEASDLDPSVLNRFVFHLELKAPRTNARLKMIEKLLEPVAHDARLVHAVASSSVNLPAQINMAAKFATLSCSNAKQARDAPLISALRAGHRAMGKTYASGLEDLKDSEWDINALCVEASAPLSKILAALKYAPSASLAFHGVPGTGKTSLARYIAQTLNRPLLAKRVSDLSSKWLGATEQSIADMFREACDENAVLLLDEGDSFLRDRQLAHASWEVTQVNELLQQMESYKGIFICATNLMDDIDVAALRRFTFKVRFLPLDLQRRVQMFARFAMGDPVARIRTEIEQRLVKLDQLAPGDFATIRRQEAVLNERFDPSYWISELEREHAMRQPHAKNRLGFV